jgi:hypothetical protein
MTDKTQKQQRSSSKQEQDLAEGSNRAKDPNDWVTGDEPMTGAQASYLKTLSQETGEEFDPNLSKAEASKRIDELKSRDPRLNRK